MTWRKVRWTLAVVFGTITLGGWALWLTVRPWSKRWGVDPTEAARSLAGDDLVSDSTVSDTRGIAIGAPPEAVWPWLVQMGFGRAGWYSYDAVDMRGSSAHRIVPELQTLAVGDTVPTHPTGGFEVRVVEPGRALVLYFDNELMARQAGRVHAGVEETPTNLEAAGAFMSVAQPSEFRASWAFVLEPDGAGGTRFIERFRGRFEGGKKPWMRFTMPVMGFGLFVMMRKQMLGIRDRAERMAAGRGEPA